MDFNAWLTIVKRTLNARQPDADIRLLDLDACKLAFDAGLSPVLYVTQSTGKQILLDKLPPIQNRNSSNSGTWILLALILVGGLAIMARNRSQATDRSADSNVPTNDASSMPRGKRQSKVMKNESFDQRLVPGVAGAKRWNHMNLPTKQIDQVSNVEATTNEGASSNQDSLPIEAPPSSTHHLIAGVKLSDAKISFENDGHGHEQAIGKVLIQNNGDFTITDFRLSLTAGTGEWALIPFEGSIEFPRSILSRRIEPGGSLEVPVMTSGYYTSFSVYGTKQVSIEATTDGTPAKIFDTANIF